MTVNTMDLSQYDVSLQTAFVPELGTAPLLPSAFTREQELVNDLAEAISSLELRDKVDKLPRRDIDDYASLSLSEKRRLLVVLTFVAHGYIWGNGQSSVLDRLPETIAVPLDHLSRELGTVPLGTYASTVLWNSRLKDPTQGWCLENVLIDLTFTGTDDEALFYNISACVEAMGGQALRSLWSILQQIRGGDPDLSEIGKSFLEAQTALQHMLVTLRKTSQMNPEIFYRRIRPYFAGWQLIEPQGVHYAGVDMPSVYRSYVGISAAQSSLFQALDIVFDISHNGFGATYLSEVRQHMPSPHRRFLEHLEQNFMGTLKDFIDHHPEFLHSYNTCLHSLADFRASHGSLVRKYAVIPASLPNQRAFGLTKAINGEPRGTGGTQLRQFLNAIWKDTLKAKL